MALSKAEKARRTEEARESGELLREILDTAGLAFPHREGDRARRVYVTVTSVSRSGMSRQMKVLVGNSTTGNISNITRRVARVLGWRYSDRNGTVTVDGCGMDMGFHLVYSLSHALYGDGYALAKDWL